MIRWEFGTIPFRQFIDIRTFTAKCHQWELDLCFFFPSHFRKVALYFLNVFHRIRNGETLIFFKELIKIYFNYCDGSGHLSNRIVITHLIAFDLLEFGLSKNFREKHIQKRDESLRNEYTKNN